MSQMPCGGSHRAKIALGGYLDNSSPIFPVTY
jgi:hypothetical protein